MMILMTAALAAAAPAVSTTPGADPHAQHMAGHSGTHERMKCCECCKDMADKKEGHVEHEGEQPH